MILCCGEALIDMLPCTTAAGARAFAPHPGGAVFNTAIALGRQAAPAGLWCGLSRDPFGEMLAAALAESGVEAGLCPRSDRPTTLAFVVLDAGQARYAFYDENTAARMVASADLPALPETVSTLFFGGISLVAEPCGTAHEALAARESGRRLVMLDPNIRPSFIRDSAAYRARLDRMIALADIVKLSNEDLAWLFGPGDVVAQARGLLARGPRLVVITRGPEGAFAVTDAHHVTVPSSRVTVIDTVGAGDAFNAGLLAQLHAAGRLDSAALATLDAAALHAALTQGAAIAAATVARAGADPPWRDAPEP